MTTDIMNWLELKDLKLVKAPKFRKIKFKQISYSAIYDRWLKFKEKQEQVTKSLANAKDNLASVEIDAPTYNTKKGASIISKKAKKVAELEAKLIAVASRQQMSKEQISNRAIKLKEHMLAGMRLNESNIFSLSDEGKETLFESNPIVVDESKEDEQKETTATVQDDVVQGILEEEQKKTADAVQEIAGTNIQPEEIKNAVNLAFAGESNHVSNDEVESTKEDAITKVVKNASNKAKVQKFVDGVYSLTRDELDPSFRITPIDGSEYIAPVTTINNDIFGQTESEERIVPIVAADRDAIADKTEEKLFHFAEQDNIASTTEVDFSKDNLSNIQTEVVVKSEQKEDEKITATDHIADEIANVASLDEIRAIKETVLKLQETVKEQEMRTIEAARKAEEAERQRQEVVQKALESAKREKEALETMLNDSKAAEEQNLSKMQQEQVVIQEISSMFQGTPVNFVIPTTQAVSKSVSKGGK